MIIMYFGFSRSFSQETLDLLLVSYYNYSHVLNNKPVASHYSDSFEVDGIFIGLVSSGAYLFCVEDKFEDLILMCKFLMGGCDNWFELFRSAAIVLSGLG